MVKKIRKALAICLAVVLCMSLVPATVFAAETATTTDEQGLTVVTVQDTVTEVDEDGNVVVKVIIDETKTGVTVDGIIVDSVKHREDTTVTDSEGNQLGTTFEENGTERKEWDGEVEPGDDTSTVPAIKAEVKSEADEDGNVTVGGSATGTPVTKTEGNTTTTTTVDREMNGTQKAEDATVEYGETKYEATVAPDTDKEYWDPYSNNSKLYPQREGVSNDNISQIVKPSQAQPEPEEGGYDFFLSGLGEYTDAAAPVFKHIVYKRDAEGNPIPDGNGGYLIDEEKSKLIDGSQGKAPQSGMDYQPSQLVLTYKDGSEFYAYCADYLVETDQIPGHRYKLENLEDSGHYSKEDAAKLRAIVENGYWGTKEGLGSIDKIKALLTEYAASNPKVTVKDKNGKDVEYDLASLIEGLKEHEALAVTQAAIWAYSINRQDEKAGVDKVVVVGAKSAIKCYNTKGGEQSEYRAANNQENLYAITGKGNAQSLATAWGITVEELNALMAAREAAALESDARMQALFDLLMNITPKTNEDEGVTTVINEKNNVENMGFIVKDKAADNAANKDDNKDNDVYDIDLTFTLAFVPGENDELYVCLLDAEGNPIVDKDGNPITERLADPSNPESAGLRPDANGVYTLKGLQIGENSDFTFDLELSGTQYLQNGVYLYTAQGGRLASQTLVGMAKGERDVAVHNNMTINFNVDESKHVVAETEWDTKGDPIILPEGGIEGGEEEDTLDENPVVPGDGEIAEPELEIEEIEKINKVTIKKANTETILDEEVPLAAAPKTGDYTFVLIAVIAVLALGIAATFFFEKKRRNSK